MNYLAHLYFSEPRPLAWAGSLMGDFVKGTVSDDLPAELAQHLRLHRRIDSYTQQNTHFQTSRQRLDPRFRYARSVLVDVFYDHFLACRWQQFSPCALLGFSQQVYAGLQSCWAYLPLPLQQQLPRMIEHNWLYSYRRPEIVARVLQRLEARLQHRIPLADGFGELAVCRAQLEDDFTAFMQDTQQLVQGWKQELGIIHP